MEAYTLHEAVEADAETILAIELAAFEEFRGRLDPPSGVFQETVERVRAKMAAGRFVLALASSHPIGSVFYEPERDHVYLGRLAVLPAHRRRGVGQALIAYVEGRAMALGIPRVRLSVRVALPVQRARYERMGYQIISEHIHNGYSAPTYFILEKVV